MSSTQHRHSTRVLSLRTEVDPVLSVVAPLGLAAAAAKPCLLIDLDKNGPGYPGHRSLADLVAEGPNRVELVPSLDHRHSSGIAILRNGGVDWNSASAIVEALALNWPAMVLRLPNVPKFPGLDSADEISTPWNLVPVVPLFPGVLAPKGGRAAVWQSLGTGESAPGPGPVLPPLSRWRLTNLLKMRFEPRGRWVKAWRVVWELPWA